MGLPRPSLPFRRVECSRGPSGDGPETLEAGLNMITLAAGRDARDATRTQESEAVATMSIGSRIGERQIESIAYAKALLPKVLKNEAQLRRQAADEIAEAAGSEASEEDRRRYASEVDSAAAAMEPQVLCISFPDGGYLECRDATQAFYGASTVVIRFDDEGNYEEAEVDFE